MLAGHPWCFWILWSARTAKGRCIAADTMPLQGYYRVPYSNCSIIGPQNLILIMKAPILIAGVQSVLMRSPSCPHGSQSRACCRKRGILGEPAFGKRHLALDLLFDTLYIPSSCKTCGALHGARSELQAGGRPAGGGAHGVVDQFGEPLRQKPEGRRQYTIIVILIDYSQL